MHEHILHGCRITPLASYLKGLGILRLLSAQQDQDVRGFWREDTFVLRSPLSRDDILAFFVERYRPTPILAPWNGGSGFYPKDNTESIESLMASRSSRLEPYRTSIGMSREVLERLSIQEKTEDKEIKATLLEALRGTLPDEALPWLDAAFVLTGEGPKYPPLLGTGGNDGRLDFTNNFMQRVVEVIPMDEARETGVVRSWLQRSLFEELVSGSSKGAVGQFYPGAAGGANSETGFDGDSRINPWDFILMIEGTVAFAAASVRRLETDLRGGALSAPFTVHAVGVGYGSASGSDEALSRAEMWLPIWSRPCRVSEVLGLFGEGRARVGRDQRPARNGIDFARAIAGLGVDRGVTSFQRIGFQVRNGLSYLATPLGRMDVYRRDQEVLLHELDRWMEMFRSKTRPDTAPGSVKIAARRLEEAILEMCQSDTRGRVQDVLVALGHCERALARRESAPSTR